MKEGGTGGSSTQTGLNFENKVDLLTLIRRLPNYEVKWSRKAGQEIIFRGSLVARCFKKHDFYKFLEKNQVDWRTKISKKLLPDDALLVIVRETLFIIEVKYQQVTGSVDEKLQTCDFKRKRNCSPLSQGNRIPVYTGKRPAPVTCHSLRPAPGPTPYRGRLWTQPCGQLSPCTNSSGTNWAGAAPLSAPAPL